MPIQETFAPPITAVFRPFRRTRLVALVSLLVLAVSCFGIVRRLSPERKLLLFDLGVASIFITTSGLAARRFIAVEACSRRRTIVAIWIGVTSAAASQGVLAMTLTGTPAGLEQLPALIGVQLLGYVCGGLLGFFTAFFAAGPVVAAHHLTKGAITKRDGAFVGAVVGLVDGWIIADMPHLGRWFIVTSAVVCAVAGFRAPVVFKNARCRLRRVP
jgi:hypothetical protein